MNESNLTFIINSIGSIASISGLYSTDFSYNDVSGVRQIFQDLYSAYPAFEAPLLTFLQSANTIETPTLQMDVSGTDYYVVFNNGTTNSAYVYNVYYSYPTTLTIDVSFTDVSGVEYLAPVSVSSVAVESNLNNTTSKIQFTGLSLNTPYTVYGVVANTTGGVSAPSNKFTFSL